MAASATTRALGVDELLENILVHFSMVELFALKRVCSHWNGVISNSPAIQKILFLRPDPDRAEVQVNPLFHCHLSDSYTTEGEEGQISHFVVSSTKLDLLRDGVPMAWRSMLMFQPPRRYNLTLRASTSYGFSLDLPIEKHDPVMAAVEKAATILKLEEEKGRNASSTIDRAMMEWFARRASGSGPPLGPRGQRIIQDA